MLTTGLGSGSHQQIPSGSSLLLGGAMGFLVASSLRNEGAVVLVPGFPSRPEGFDLGDLFALKPAASGS